MFDAGSKFVFVHTAPHPGRPRRPVTGAPTPWNLAGSRAACHDPGTMKTHLLSVILALSIVFSAASAGAKPKKHRAKKAKSTTPAALVTPASFVTPVAEAPAAPAKPREAKKASAPASASAAAPKVSQFIASGVPLAEVRDGRLKSAGSAKNPCGKKNQWAKIGSEWSALDAWGQIIQSRATIADRRFFEGSGCHEVSFSTPGDPGVAARLFVAKGSGYAPAASAEWKADKDHVKRFEQLYTMQESVWVEGKAGKISAETRGRTLFFRLPKQDGSVEGAPTERRATQWAVAGGRLLVVGYISAAGTWKVGHVMPPNGKERAYEPIAILDMNGDGLPEIVVHEEAGGVFVDRVLSFDPGTMRWEKAVESPGGATL
jgi:hypothetical protein